ncbi:MAG: DNA damage-inducible protein D, partial [Candidatus Binataceae bacterium]
GLPAKAEILDHAGRAELAAHEFKNAQTEQQLIGRKVQGEESAIDTHHRVGREVRDAIRRIGGTLPEDLKAEESVKKVQAARKKQLLEPPSKD